MKEMALKRGAVVIAGALAQKPHQGGHTWVFLQYLLGFRQLGYDVTFIDRLEPGMCVDAAGAACGVDDSVNLRYFRDVLGRFELLDHATLLYDGGRRAIGMPRESLIQRVRQSDVLINFMGYLDDAELLAAAPMRVFFDFDPGFGQMWQALGLRQMFVGHDQYVTVGENIGRANSGCTIPTCGIEWIETKQPIMLEHWPVADGAAENAPFTSIGAWRGPYDPIDYDGRRYGLRVHEFRKFLDLPRRTGQPFEVALDIHATESRDLNALAEHGWRLTRPSEVAADPWAYRRFIASSQGEFGVAKNMYVDSRSGWLSDRTICYLASGRPAIVQDTGLTGLLPLGRGLLSYSTLDEATAAVEEVVADYPRHCRAARAVVEECFDSDKVLSRLLGKMGVA